MPRERGQGDKFIGARVAQVGLTDEGGTEGALLLQLETGSTFSMRAFGGEVARHIARFLQGDRSSVPTVYNLVEELAEIQGLHLEEVRVYGRNGVMRADLLFVKSEDSIVLRNYRASDAIALAVFYDAPIFLQSSLVVEEKG